jgi:protein transport protein HofC
VLACADILQQGSLPLAIISLMLAILLSRLQKHSGWLRYQQRILLACPVTGQLVLGQKLSQIFTVLSLTQQAGIAFLQGLESVKETLTCPWWRDIVDAIHQDITQGQSISAAFSARGVFTPLCIQLVSTGKPQARWTQCYSIWQSIIVNRRSIRLTVWRPYWSLYCWW